MTGDIGISHLPVEPDITLYLEAICVGMFAGLVIDDISVSRHGDDPVGAELPAVGVDDGVLVEHAGAVGREPAARGGGCDALLQEREVRRAASDQLRPLQNSDSWRL